MGILDRISARAALTGAALALSGCLFFGGDKVAGGGGGIEAVGIAGLATAPDGKPISGATVVMRRAAYLKAGSAPMPKAGKDSAETVTGSDGRFRIDSVDPGDYRLEIASGTALAMIVEATVIPQAQGDVEVKARLDLVGTLSGTVWVGGAPGEGAYLGLYGSERSATANAQGKFAFTDMPAGKYVLAVRYRLPTGRMLQSDVQGVVVVAGASAVLDTLRLSTDCPDYACDSLAVRKILDDNGKAGTAVTKVALKGSDNRIGQLQLQNLGLNSLPRDVADLSALFELNLNDNNLKTLPPELAFLKSLAYLSVENNALDSVPAVVPMLKALRWLYLSGNSIKSSTAALGSLDSLKYLGLADCGLDRLAPELVKLKELRQLSLTKNLLSDLPAGLTALPNLKRVEVDTNKFCSPTSEVQTFLDANASNTEWRTTQVCPKLQCK